MYIVTSKIYVWVDKNVGYKYDNGKLKNTTLKCKTNSCSIKILLIQHEPVYASHNKYMIIILPKNLKEL